MRRQLAVGSAPPGRPRSSTPSITPSALGQARPRPPRRGTPEAAATAIDSAIAPQHRPEHPRVGQRQHQPRAPEASSTGGGAGRGRRIHGSSPVPSRPPGRARARQRGAGACGRRPLGPAGGQRSSKLTRWTWTRSEIPSRAARSADRPAHGWVVDEVHDRVDAGVGGVGGEDLLAAGAALGGQLQLERDPVPG